eukprot:scaffold2158_cov238-Skeletonema_menzelii.AAC.1
MDFRAVLVSEAAIGISNTEYNQSSTIFSESYVGTMRTSLESEALSSSWMPCRRHCISEPEPMKN